MATSNSKGPAKGPAKTKSAANAIITTVAVLATLVLINWVADRFPHRLDLTEDGGYSLSQHSRQLVGALPDRMNVKLFVSSDLPAQFKPTAQYVRDMLDEYRAASNGKFDWEAIDPTSGKTPEEKKEHQDAVSKYKIEKMAIESITNNKLEIGAENYLGIAFSYGDKIESIPQITRPEGLEYQVTGMIKRMTATKKSKIGFAATEGELSPQQGLQLFGQVLGRDYDTAAVQLDKPIPDDVDVLFIAGPKQPFNDKAKYYVDQFLMKGKGVALFLDGMKVEAPQGMQMQMPGMDQPKLGQPNDTNLQDLLEKYGVKVGSDLVFDEQNAPGPVPFRGQMMLANYPTFVAIAGDGLDNSSEMTHRLGALIMPFASSVELVGDLKDGKGDVKATPIARTTQKSWRNAGFFVFNPLQPMQPPSSPSDKGPFVLGYSLAGKFKSAYPGGMPGSEPGTSAPENADAKKESPPDTRFLIMASSGMLDDHQLPFQQVPPYIKNLQFAANAADWLLKDDALASLRAKGIMQRPFTPSVDSNHNAWRWIIQLGLPLMLVVFGLGLWLVRSARRRAATLDSL